MNTLGDVVRDGIATLMLFTAGGGLTLGVLALLRFPDFYTRAHALSLIGGWPLGLALLGLAVASRDGQTSGALVLLALVAPALAGPIAHASVSAAQAGGLVPLTGRFVSGDDNENAP
jgi:multicomponent Na+:H+ antiporter subunit G